MRRTDRATALTLVLSPLLSPSTLAAGVVINEIHYHPPAADFRQVEFVEIHNDGTQIEALGGWQIRGGIEFTFAQGTTLPPGEYLVVAKNAAEVEKRFALGAQAVVGDFKDSLENSGESLELVDASNAFVDGLTYDDEAPWPAKADGDGFSLQRVCATESAQNPLNWLAGSPTPGASNAGAICPLPPPRPTTAVINEIHYHPRVIDTTPHPALEDAEDQEFLEILNATTAQLDVSGWKLSGGVDLLIPAGTTMPPQGILVAGRDPERLKSLLGITNVISVGYDGTLSNTGERVSLEDLQGNVVDSVQYADAGDWPSAADGAGRSLERVSAATSGEDPRNWRASRIQTSTFVRLSAEGPPGAGLSQRLILAIDGAGEFLVDRVTLEDLTTPPARIILDETFDQGMTDWTATGTASGSVHAPGAGATGSGALRLVSTGPCPNGECGSANSVSRTVNGVGRQGKFRVTVEVKAVRGSPGFLGGLARGASVSIDEVTSAGSPNTTSGGVLPPFVDHVSRFPAEPRSSDTVWITARVRSQTAPDVRLNYEAFTSGSPSGPGALVLLDDGQHHDHVAGDGVYGVEIPPFPHDTQVRFRIEATAGGVTGEYPIPFNAGSPLPHEVAGYYVDDVQPVSNLPVYHLLFPQIHGAEISQVNDLLRNCDVTVPATFVSNGDIFPDVQIRFRGNTACYVLKRNFKVTFNRGRYFRGLKKINLNSEWTDKSLVREQLSWDFLRQVGAPYCDTQFIRVHLNGEYFGLYMYVEHPDQRFLARNGLDRQGNLYKAKQPPAEVGFPIGVSKQSTLNDYLKFWEAETNDGTDFTDLRKFIDDMHADGTRAGGPTDTFWKARAIPEMIIGYQLGQVALNNIDSFAKNHFLYHDLEKDLFGFITWDLDLTFGKFFTFQAVDPGQGREVGTLNDLLLCSPQIDGDLNPWFGATVLQNLLLNYLVDFFLRAGNGSFQRAYLTQLWDILEEKMTNGTYNPQLDALLTKLSSEEAEDRARWGRFPSNVQGWPEDMASNIEVVKQQISCHRDFLESYIRSFHSTIPNHPRLKITEILYAPDGGDSKLEFLEIWNMGSTDVNLRNWSITGLGGDQEAFVILDTEPVRAGEVFIVAKSPDDFREHYPDAGAVRVIGPYDGKLADEGEEIRLRDAGSGYPATIDLVKYENGGAWPVVHPGHSIELTKPSRERDNDLGDAWVESAQPGGSPGRLLSVPEPTFVRGNGNNDSKVDVTDAVFLLAHLFGGSAGPVCPDAADADDNGKLDIADAIFMLRYLFQGGSPLAPPYPEAGTDPTEDALGCST